MQRARLLQHDRTDPQPARRFCLIIKVGTSLSDTRLRVRGASPCPADKRSIMIFNFINLTNLGFDMARTAYAVRTALAACFAFTFAWYIGLEHPQWAAMTVWATSQPTRGHLLEKSFFRLLGTIAGTIVGVALVHYLTPQPMVLVLCFALWVGICTFVGYLQKTFIAYGCFLGGYTAGMIAFLDTAHPEAIFLVGIDRLATIVLGIIAATVVGYLFTGYARSDILRNRILGLLAELFEKLGSSPSGLSPEDEREVLSRLSAIDGELDQYATGSVQRHKRIYAMRGVLIAAVSLILSAKSRATVLPQQLTADEICEACELLRHGNLPEIIAHLSFIQALDQEDDSPAERLYSALLRLNEIELKPLGTLTSPKTAHIILHRDWTGAVEAGLRATLCLLAVGSIWAYSQSQMVGYILLGIGTMLALFSNLERPASSMRTVFVGQCYGVIAALLCRWVLWPLAESEWQMILLTLPVMLIAPLLIGHNKTTSSSFDYNMVSNLLLWPEWPMTETFDVSVLHGLAVLSTPIIALYAFKYMFPATIARKVDVLIGILARELEGLAADEKALSKRLTWQARFYHRTLVLMRQVDISKRHSDRAHHITSAFFTMGQLVMRIRQLLSTDDLSAAQRRALRVALLRMQAVSCKPEVLPLLLSSAASLFEGADQLLLNEAAKSAETLSDVLKA
jgi:uncharacterized membrane protein YccC